MWLDTAALKSQLVSRLGRAETLKYGGAPCLREIRPPSMSEDSRHCQLTIQSDNENSRAGDDAGGSQGREQYNGGEAGHTQEVLKLEDHWATLLMGCRKWSLRCRVVALVDKR